MREVIQTAGAIIGGIIAVVLFLPFIASIFPIRMGDDIDRLIDKIKIPKWLMTSGYIVVVFITIYCMFTL